MSEREFQHEPDDELLSAYIDGELSPEERAAVEARLASDPDAQQLLHQLRSVSQSVQALPQASASPNLRDAILRQIEARKPASTASGDDAAKTLTGTIANDSIFQSRRPWIWATLALAAGLLIMVSQSNKESADKLRQVAQNASSSDVDRKLAEGRREPETSAPEGASSIANSSELEQSRIDLLASSPAPTPQQLAREDQASRDKTSAALSDLPAAAPAVPNAQPSSSTTAAMDELKAVDRFAGASAPLSPSGGASPEAPLAAAEPQDAAAVPTNETLNAGGGAGGGRSFKGGPSGASPSTIAANSPQSPSLAVGAPVAPPSEPQSESGAAQNSLVVVHVVAKQAAFEKKSFDVLLKKRGINVESEPPREASGRGGGVATRAESGSAVEREKLTEQKSTASREESEDVVLVDAPKSTIVEFLSELKDDVENYSSIAVDEPASGQDRSAVNGVLKKELALDLGVFNRGVATEKQKDDANGRLHFYGLGREGAQPAAPRGSVDRSQQVRLDAAKEVRRSSLEPAGSGRARRLSAFDIKQSQVEQSVERGRGPGFAGDADKSVMRRSASRALQAADGENDNLQVLFVVSPEQAAAPSAPAAKPAE